MFEDVKVLPLAVLGNFCFYYGCRSALETSTKQPINQHLF